MKTLGTLALKVLGFFAFILSVFMWGKAEAKLKEAKKRADNAIKESKRMSENNALPYVDDPAMCLYDVSEDDDLPEDEKKTCD